MSALGIAENSPADDGRPREVAASFGQRRMWLLDQLGELDARSMYSESVCVRAHGPLDVDVLSCCVQQLIRRHEVLRTRLVLREGGLIQVVEPESVADAVRVEFTVLADELPGQEQPAAISRLVDEYLTRPMDLGVDLPIRVLVVTVAPDEHVVLMRTHHACVDDWSLLILEWDLVAWYAHLIDGAPSPPPPSESYLDYCGRQQEFVGSTRWRQQLEYWRGQLEGAPPRLDMRVAKPATTEGSRRWNEGRREYFELPPTLMRDLGSVARKYGHSLFDAALAAFGVLLWQWSGSADVPVGVPVTERTLTDYSTVLGFFGNTVVARLRLTPDMSFADVIDHTQRVMADARAHQAIPFEAVAEELRPARRRRDVPLFNTLFAMRLNRRTMQAGGVSFAPEPDIGNPGIAKVDLMFLLDQRDDRHHGLVEYRTDVFDAASAHRIVEDYLRLLTAIVAGPDRFLKELTVTVTSDEGTTSPHDDSRGDLDTEYRPPETDLERLLCAIWRELLARPAVGVDDDFVELGGHSLLAALVAMRVREQLDVDLTPGWFFDAPTVRALALDITDHRSSEAGHD